MKFLHPEFIYYMILPLIILFSLLLTQKEAIGSFFSDEVMQKLRVDSNSLTLKARNGLFFLAGLFMILALSEPVYIDGKVKIEQKSADILVALDISNSMLANDVYPNRLALSKKKAIDFISSLTSDRVGVIAFASGSYLVSPLSFDKEAVAFLLKNLDTSSITEQGTNFLSLLDVAKSTSKKSKEKYLVIFSDGGDKKDFSKEIKYAKENGIIVFVLGIATKKGSPIRLKNGEFMRYKGEIVITKLNQNISSFALGTGGVYVEYTNSNKDIKALKNELEKIVRKEELKAKMVEKYIPLFYFPLGFAMILILIATSSMTKRVEVEVPSIFLIGFLILFAPQAKASLFDFVDIKEAKEMYNKKDYLSSANKYEKYAKKSKKPEAYYNAGNGYYKAKMYKQAIKNYKKVQTNNSDLMARTLANLGNAYVKINQLQKAIEYYEDSLKLYEDKEVRQNLEEIKKYLKNKKKQNSQQNKQQKQNNLKNNKSDNNKKNSKNQQSKSQNNKNQNNKKNSKKNSKENSNHKKLDKQKNDKKNKSNKSEQKTKQAKQKEGKSLMSKVKHNEKFMTNKEEKKWLKELNKDSKTFLYMIKPAQNGDINEKPW